MRCLFFESEVTVRGSADFSISEDNSKSVYTQSRGVHMSI
jgi:hypothetical protein